MSERWSRPRVVEGEVRYRQRPPLRISLAQARKGSLLESRVHGGRETEAMGQGWDEGGAGHDEEP